MLSIIFCLQKEISWGDILLSLIFFAGNKSCGEKLCYQLFFACKRKSRGDIFCYPWFFCRQKISWGVIVLSFIFSIRLTELANETLGIKVPPLFLAATGLTELAGCTLWREGFICKCCWASCGRNERGVSAQGDKKWKMRFPFVTRCFLSQWILSWEADFCRDHVDAIPTQLPQRV